MNSTKIGEQGLLQFYPEHIPSMWYKATNELKLKFSVEYSYWEDQEYNRVIRKNKRSFDTAEEAMKLFDEWKLKYPKAELNWLGFGG